MATIIEALGTAGILGADGRHLKEAELLPLEVHNSGDCGAG